MKHFILFLAVLFSFSALNAQNITLSFDNAEITTEGPDSFYEIDVMITSDVTFSMGSGQFFLDYNSAAFGTQVDNNSAIEYERPETTLLGGEVIVDVNGTDVPLGAHYTSFISNDTTDDKVSFIWQQNASGGMYGDNVSAGTTVPLVHVKIKFLDGATGEDPSICFDATNPFDDQFFTACGPYDPLVGFDFEGADCQGEPGSQIFDYTPDCSLPVPFEVACLDATVSLDANGVASINAAQVFDGDVNDPTIDTLSLDIDSFDCSNIGENIVTLTVTATDGSTASCTATVTVEDTLAPEAICQNITVQLDANGNASITAADLDGGSNDNCGVASLSISQETFTTTDVGDTIVILTVTDVNGNEGTCEAIVTIVDQVFPEAVCQNITIQLDENGNATITPEQVDGGSTGVDSSVIDITSFDCSTIGENTVTLTVTSVDDHSDSCTAIVTVEDTLAPEAICQNITLQLDPNGNASITAADLDDGSTDNCGVASLSVDTTSFNCSNIGANTVTLTVTDQNGNTDTCTAIVTIEDLIAPEISCPEDLTIELTDDMPVFELPDYVATGEATASDNCEPVALFTQDPAPGTLLEEGTYSITLCATDASGNESCCSFNLIVEDVLGINENTLLASLEMYPNPATTTVFIANPNALPINHIAIYDIGGRLVAEHKQNGLINEMSFDVSTLAKGAYFVRIEGAQGSVTKRLIKR